MSRISRRLFIRHTAEVPIQIRSVTNGRTTRRSSRNVGYGGLSFDSDEPLEPGQAVELRIEDVRPPFAARGVVAWCSPEEGRFAVGVAFLDPADAFRSRMVQQVCAIERYRKEVRRRDGRELTPADAAAEWIQKFADHFPA